MDGLRNDARPIFIPKTLCSLVVSCCRSIVLTASIQDSFAHRNAGLFRQRYLSQEKLMLKGRWSLLATLSLAIFTATLVSSVNAGPKEDALKVYRPVVKAFELPTSTRSSSSTQRTCSLWAPRARLS